MLTFYQHFTKNIEDEEKFEDFRWNFLSWGDVEKERKKEE
jgi:hypothetical protein